MPHSEKKSSIRGIVFAVKKYSIHDGPGIRTSVFFKGCPLNCWWCHNPECISTEREIYIWDDKCIGCGDCSNICSTGAIYPIQDFIQTDMKKCTLCGKCVEVCPSGAREIIGKKITVSQLMEEIKKDTIFYDDSGGGVTFSGGEPLTQPLFLSALLHECKQQKIHTAVDTSGYASTKILIEISKSVDLFLFDLKFIDDFKHKKYTGVSNQIILKNLKELSSINKKIIIRIPIVPGINDDHKNILKISEFVASLKNVSQVDVLPFHKIGVEKYKRFGMNYRLPEVQYSSKNRIAEIENQLKKYRFKVVIKG